MSSTQAVRTMDIKSNKAFPGHQHPKRKAAKDPQHTGKPPKVCVVEPTSKPTPKCRFFPACRMGQKCHFTHPMCKYNAACRKPKCIFKHIGPRKLEMWAANNKENIYRWRKPEDETKKPAETKKDSQKH